jgi:hypothetical protein
MKSQNTIDIETELVLVGLQIYDARRCGDQDGLGYLIPRHEDLLDRLENEKFHDYFTEELVIVNEVLAKFDGFGDTDLRLAKGPSSIRVEEVYHQDQGDVLIGQSAMFYDRAVLLHTLDLVREAKDKENAKAILFQECDAITCSVAFARDKKAHKLISKICED